MFEIGQQVVCTYDGPWVDCQTFEPAHGPVPRAGGVYTISGFDMRNWFLGISLEEITWPRPDGKPATFDSRAFRPVRKTSIEDFQKLLLTPPKVLEDA